MAFIYLLALARSQRTRSPRVPRSGDGGAVMVAETVEDTGALVLYHGDNGDHEFYESEEESEPFILRHPGARCWTLLPSPYCDNETIEVTIGELPDLIALLHRWTGRRIAIDDSKRWSHIAPGEGCELIEV